MAASPVRAEESSDGSALSGTDSGVWRSRWPAFSWGEGIATVSAGAATGVFALRSPPGQSHWQGGIWFDDGIRSELRLGSSQSRQRARTIGDLPYYAAPLIPLIVDPLVAALIHDDGKAALNLELIGLEAFSYAGLLSFVSTSISRRERPDTTECLRQRPDGAGCEFDTEAFWSGHTSITAASAGLVCANHRYMPLWGSPVADAAACGVAVSGAVVTGVTRLLSDRHYTTDVVAGMGVGFAFGYLVPVLLHFERERPPVTVTLQPDGLGAGASLSASGVF